MIPEITIIHLQAIAAALMGYDYFMSDALKEKANVATTNFVRGQQDFVDKQLREQTTVFFKALPIIFTGAFFALLAWGTLLLAGLVSNEWW